MPDLLTTAQAAARLGLSESHVRRLARDRHMPRTGRDYLLTEAQVAQLAARETTAGRKPASALAARG